MSKHARRNIIREGVREKTKVERKMFVSEINKENLTDEIIDRVLYKDIADSGEDADCIIVLGSMKASQYRIPLAVQAYKQGRASKLLLSGGSVRNFEEGQMSEAEHMRKKAISMGVNPDDVILDINSHNTVENMFGILMELQRSFWINNVKSVLLVTTAYHMRRSLALAKYLFPEHIKVIPCPADDKNTRRDNWMNGEEGKTRAVREVENIIKCVENGLFPDFEI